LAIIAAVGAVAVVAAIALTLRSLGERHQTHHADPHKVALPGAAPNKFAVSLFFLGRGASLSRMARLALPRQRPVDHCQAFATSLENVASPRALADLSLDVPDPTIKSAFLNDVGALARYVAACADGSGYGDAYRQLSFTTTVLHRVLHENGLA
jgi:hypothetical protein